MYHKDRGNSNPHILIFYGGVLCQKNEIIKRKYAGLPLTDEEYAIYRAWQEKKPEQARERRHRLKAETQIAEPQKESA